MERRSAGERADCGKAVLRCRPRRWGLEASRIRKAKLAGMRSKIKRIPACADSAPAGPRLNFVAQESSGPSGCLLHSGLAAHGTLRRACAPGQPAGPPLKDKTILRSKICRFLAKKPRPGPGITLSTMLRFLPVLLRSSLAAQARSQIYAPPHPQKPSL